MHYVATDYSKACGWPRGESGVVIPGIRVGMIRFHEFSVFQT